MLKLHRGLAALAVELSHTWHGFKQTVSIDIGKHCDKTSSVPTAFQRAKQPPGCHCAVCESQHKQVFSGSTTRP